VRNKIIGEGVLKKVGFAEDGAEAMVVCQLNMTIELTKGEAEEFATGETCVVKIVPDRGVKGLCIRVDME
jgi:hypothetical protein